MRCILRPETDPWFNIAAEEFIFRNIAEETFMLWRNRPSVIIGKHQNAFAEVNHAFMKANDIKVVRRISGGGAVYHDQGNLNFTWTSYGNPNNLVDFERFTYPIVLALRDLGLRVEVGKRHSLYLNGLKISGNAEHAFKNKVIHHGTLLFNSDLQALDSAIKPSSIKFEDKAVKSVRSNVTNISNYLSQQISIEAFSDFVFSKIMQYNPASKKYSLSDDDITEINTLRDTKYSGWDWNYGYSPAFHMETTLLTESGHCIIKCFVKNGIIQSVDVFCINPFSEKYLVLSELLTGIRLQEQHITESLAGHFSMPETDTILRALLIGE